LLAKLSALMDARGIGGSALAKLVYVDAALISRLRNGRQQPSLATADRLDKVLGADGELVALVPGPMLFGGIPDPEVPERLAWATKHPRHIDLAAVESLASVLVAQRHAEESGQHEGARCVDGRAARARHRPVAGRAA
jgi:transcriptional regulator with XRE-family HTH domain